MLVRLTRLAALVLVASCGARPVTTTVVAPVPATVVTEMAGTEQKAGPWFEPVVAVAQEFPAGLDDVALAHMVAWGRGFTLEAFFAEDSAEGLPVGLDLMNHQMPLSEHHEDTPEGRLLREADAHYRRYSAGLPETSATLVALLDAAEAVPLYDMGLVAHLWRDGRALASAPVTLFARLDRHARILKALRLAARGSRIATDWVSPGLAAAARLKFADADAGAWDTSGTLLLHLAEGTAVLVRRGTAVELAPGAAVELRRLDAVRAPRTPALLRHAILGDVLVPAGSEVTAWNVSGLLTDLQRGAIRRLVAAMRDGDREACATVEAMLPAAHWAISESLESRPVGDGENDFYNLLPRFETAE